MNTALVSHMAQAINASLAIADTSELTLTYLNYLYIALGVIALVGFLTWFGWRNRKKRQSDVPAPKEIPGELLESEPVAAAEGMVIGTVTAEHYLDRIAVHQLGVRTNGRIELHSQGLAVFRAGARNFLIPAEDFTHVRTGRGIIGKFVESDGAIIIGWTLGEYAVETAFRARFASAHRQVVEAFNARIDADTANLSPDTPPETAASPDDVEEKNTTP